MDTDMKVGQIWGALRNGKPIGFKIVKIFDLGAWVPAKLIEAGDAPHTLMGVINVKDSETPLLVKYITAQGHPRGWTLIEDVK